MMIYHVEHVNNCTSVVIVIHLKLDYVCLDSVLRLSLMFFALKKYLPVWKFLCEYIFFMYCHFCWLCTRDLEPRIILIAVMFYSEIRSSSLQSQDIENVLAAIVDSTGNCYMHIEKKLQ